MDLFKQLKLNQKEFNALRFSYCAACIKQIKNLIHNGFDEKFPTETDVFGENGFGGREKHAASIQICTVSPKIEI